MDQTTEIAPDTFILTDSGQPYPEPKGNRYLTTQFEGIPIKAVFGSFHLGSIPILNLMAGSKAEVEEIGREMLRYPIAKTYTGHCTGAKAYGVLKGVMGEKLDYVPTGKVVTVQPTVVASSTYSQLPARFAQARSPALALLVAEDRQILRERTQPSSSRR